MATAASSTPYTKLVNVYYERKAGTERPCYVCRMPTTTVLATLNTEDFLYACPKHLTDSATAIPEPTPTGPSAEDIAKAVAEHKAKEERRLAKQKGKGEGEDKGKTKEDSDKAKASPGIPSPIPSLPTAENPSTPPKTGHRRYALHRALFTMRQRELRMREQGVQAKERGKVLPQVPRGTI
ncbi:hypothetical protein QFC20_000530 [Naganishia adeliensis]|uniref:Uncharacterized protein n=1 Tax=Naganishia adeliensis TaxID=92952 RepID=A0ACC2X1G9_9TREE|nr:hypothetical protein QFC20_000530 [Naganishia adeliensis]